MKRKTPIDLFDATSIQFEMIDGNIFDLQINAGEYIKFLLFRKTNPKGIYISEKKINKLPAGVVNLKFVKRFRPAIWLTKEGNKWVAPDFKKYPELIN